MPLYIKNNKLILILTTFVCIVSLILLGYIQGRSSASLHRDFSMYPINSVHLRIGTNPVLFSDVINLDEDTEVLIISKYDNQSYAGIYDPMMREAFQSQLVLAGRTRYFSKADYQDKTLSGILIDDNLAYNIGWCKSTKTERIDDPISCIESMSRLSNNNTINEVVNLASLDHMGDDVYIESENTKALENLQDRFLKLGYDLVETERVGFVQSLFFSLTDLSAETFMAVAVLALYCLYGYTIYLYIYGQRKELTIHLIHGATFKSILGSFLRYFSFSYCCGVVLMIGVYFLYHTFNYYFLFMKFIDVIYLSLFGFIILLSFIAFSMWLNFRNLKGKMGVDYHVR